jgi:hypothetical protein
MTRAVLQGHGYCVTGPASAHGHGATGPWPGSLVGRAGLVAQSLCGLPATSLGMGAPASACRGGCHPAGGLNPGVLGSGGSGHGGHRCRGGPIGGNGEEDGSPQQRIHGGACRVGRSVGEGPKERWRLELELSASSMGTRQSSWGRWCGALRARADGVSSALATSHGDGLVASSSMLGHYSGR